MKKISSILLAVILCLNCFAFSLAEEVDGQSAVMDYIGTYDDIGTKRAVMTIEAIGQQDPVAHIVIRWSNSAEEYVEWDMTGMLDTETMIISCKDGTKSLCSVDEDGVATSVPENIIIDSEFVINDDETITWTDHIENAGEGSLFVFADGAWNFAAASELGGEVSAVSDNTLSEKRTLMEFIDLYTRRIIDFSEDMHITEIREIPVYHAYQGYDGKFRVTFNDQSMIINKETLEIEELMMNFFTDPQTIVSMSAAIAALEYSYTDENINITSSFYGLEGYTDNVTKTCYEKLRNAYAEIIKNGELLKKGKKVLLWSGNYDYYLQHNTASEIDYDCTILIAEKNLLD